MWITRNKSQAVFLCNLLLMLVGVLSQQMPRQTTYFQPIPGDGEYCSDEILGVAQVWSYLECAGRCLRKRGCAKIYWFPSTSAAGTHSCHLARDGTCNSAVTHREKFENYRLVVHTRPESYPISGFPVCFGARDNTYGEFVFRAKTGRYQLKMVHAYGGVACAATGGPRPFGCAYRSISFLSRVVLTDATNAVIANHDKFYDYDNKGLATSVVATIDCHQFTQNESYRIWYDEDLLDGTEYDNYGTSCAFVCAGDSAC